VEAKLQRAERGSEWARDDEMTVRSGEAERERERERERKRGRQGSEGGREANRGAEIAPHSTL
jgi:hypothetical protein